jgi:hypothetical protein
MDLKISLMRQMPLVPIDVTFNDSGGGLHLVELVLSRQSLGLYGKGLAGQGQGGVGVRAAKGKDHAEGVGTQLVLLLGVGPAGVASEAAHFVVDIEILLGGADQLVSVAGLLQILQGEIVAGEVEFFRANDGELEEAA